MSFNTTNDSNEFFTSLAAYSDTIGAFLEGGNPNYGPHHPINTFRSPFVPDRKKISWYFKTVVTLSPAVQLLEPEGAARPETVLPMTGFLPPGPRSHPLHAVAGSGAYPRPG